MNEAIKLAIEKGGYQEPSGYGIEIYFGSNPDYTTDTIVLDPLFWQALGKALGWSETAWFTFHVRDEGDSNRDDMNFDISLAEYFAHKYFQVVLTGGDTEKFWKELIKAPKEPLT
jgi:hypothetical protein